MEKKKDDVNEAERANADSDLALETYPLLPESIMHYALAVRDPMNLPGFKDKLMEYAELVKDGVNKTEDRVVPVTFNFPELVDIKFKFELEWNTQQAFQELVMRSVPDDVIGYWGKSFPAARTLDTLCTRTAFSRMLVQKPDQRMEWQHSFSEVSDTKSRLHNQLDEWREHFGKRGSNDPFISTIYMLHFTPRDVFIVRQKFPKVRIVGITVPRPGGQETAEINNLVEMIAKLKAANEQKKQEGK